MNRRPSEEGPLEPELFELDADRNPQTLLGQQRETEADHDGSNDHLQLLVNINTPRMWTLSLLFAVFGSSINLFFSLRYPSVSISPIIALLVAHPLGLLWDHVFPVSAEYFVDSSSTSSNRPGVSVRRGSLNESSPLLSPSSANGAASTFAGKGIALSRWRRLQVWLGQGRWNAREHCCVFISSNVSFGFAFATDVIVEQSKFYNQDPGIVYQLLLTLSTQILGYAIAGLTRSFLVRPSGMVWPGTLVATAMFSSLHKAENKPADGWTISRFKFFLWVFLGSAAFYFLPGLLIPALSYFSVITWMFPKNVVVANLFGVSSGLGLFPMTFDWSQIAYVGSPLIVPLWAALNVIGGLVIVMWIIAPIMYYSNVMDSSYMPILSSAVFDNTGNPYNVTKILTPEFFFDEAAYKDYSRVFLPMTYVLSYALQFAALPALIVHTACWYGPDIWKNCKQSFSESRAHQTRRRRSGASSTSFSRHPSVSTLRSSRSSAPQLDNLLDGADVDSLSGFVKDDVPNSWYVLTGLSMTAVGIFVVEYYPVHLPWYGLLLAIGLCSTFFIPIGIVQAITNQQSSLYLVCQLLCGALFPGKPVANMIFVTYGYISSTQGLKFASDLKLGQVYMKIPPKLLFKLQLAATLISSLTQVGILNWMLAHIPGICTPSALNGFTCPLARVHFNGSILWGVISPLRFFGPNQLYRPLLWSFPLGALAPLALFLVARRRPSWRHVHLPVAFGSLAWIPPATGLNFAVWGLLCWLFNGVVMRRRREWWGKYTMTLSAALDSGLALGVLVVFFGIVYPGFADGFTWWGTEVYKRGCDWKACAFRDVPPGGRFGPETW